MPKQKSEDWKHVLIIDKNDNTSLSKVSCIYCNKEFHGGVVRIKGHLLGDHMSGISKCSKVPGEVLEDLIKQQSQNLETCRKKRKLDVIGQATKNAANRIIEKKQLKLPYIFANSTKDDADKAIARLFYASGIPFAIADSSYFKEAICAVAKCGIDYKAPNRTRISTKMLIDEVTEVKESISTFKSEALKHGVSIISDGWTNVQNKPLMNFLASTGDCCVFLNAIDTSGEKKEGSYIACKITECIQSYGVENVVQVITDSAPNYVAARTILQQNYPNIVFSPCTTHCLDLLLEDIAKFTWIANTIIDSKNIVKFLTTHQYSLTCFRKYSNLELLKPGETRFATNFIMIQRLCLVKEALQETVISREYKKWLNDSIYKNKGQLVTDKILNECFWKTLETIKKICEPILELLRLTDGKTPCVGKVYYKMYQISQYVYPDDLSAIQKEQIHQCVMNRWKMLHTDLHSAGFMLDPEYSQYSQHQNEEIVSGFHAMVERIYRDDVQLQVKAVQQHAIYSAGLGLFARPMAIAAAKEMPAYRWWMSFGAHVPQLQQVAVRVLAQITSTSACERNWSTFDFIHTKKRNRMLCNRVRDIIFVHANLRLRDRLEKIDYTEENVEWSIQSDSESSHDIGNMD